MGNRRPIKLMYIVSSFMQCGPINMLYTLVSGLDPKDFDISAITLKREPANSRINDFKKLGVKVFPVSDKGSHFLFGLKGRMQGIVNDVHPDIVHSHGPWADYYLGRLKVDNSIMSIHNKLAEDYVPLYGSIIGGLTTLMDARAMRKSGTNVAVSNSVASTVEKKYGIDSIVIHNGVDIDKYSFPASSDAAVLRSGLGLSPDTCVFLHIGNMIERKQPKLIADSFRCALKKNGRMELVFLGDGPLLESVKRDNSDCGNMHFPGNVDNVADYMKASDAMVSATTSDGLSMATLEGLACGLRGMMSDIDVHREIVDAFIGHADDFIICDNNLESYAGAFLRLARDQGAKNSIERNDLSGKKMAENYAKLYEDIVRK